MPYAYTTLAAVKPILKIGLSDTSQDARLTTDIGTASRLINDYCHRVFATVTETRTFDAPASAVLDVPDLLAVTNLTQDGVALVAGTDYELLPHTLTGEHPAYTQVVRLQTGFQRRWGYKPLARVQVVSVPISRWGDYPFAAVDGPFGAYATSALQASTGTIQISGTWGYPAVPEPVVEAAEILTVRLYNQRLAQFKPAGTAPGTSGPPRSAPLIDAEVVAPLLAPYLYLPTPEGNG